MNRHYDPFPEKKITEKAARTPAQGPPMARELRMKETAWPVPKPVSKHSFNAVRFPVAKTHAVKRGVD